MENQVARFTTYAAFLVDGNLVTDLLSIGGKSQKTGPDPPKPASVAGLNTHAVFEGDASMTRADEFFGDNHSLNETLWEQVSRTYYTTDSTNLRSFAIVQFVEYSNIYGDGYYNKTVATELRWRRIQESIATNPEFDFTSPRFFTAYAESTFPFVFFVDGRTPTVNGESQGVHVTNATFFFKESKFPPDFHRPAEPSGPTGASDIFDAHPIPAGKNINGINSYTADPTSADFSDFCLLYRNFVNKTIKGLYPNPKGILRRNLIINLRNFFDGIDGRECEEVFPYGKL